MRADVADAGREVLDEGRALGRAGTNGRHRDGEDDRDADEGGHNVDPEGRHEAAPRVHGARDDRGEQHHRRGHGLVDAVDAHEVRRGRELREERRDRGLLEPLADGADGDGDEDEGERCAPQGHRHGQTEGDEGDEGIGHGDDGAPVRTVGEGSARQGHDGLGDERDEGVQAHDPPLLEGEGEVPHDRVLNDVGPEQGDRLGGEEEGDAALPPGVGLDRLGGGGWRRHDAGRDRARFVGPEGGAGIVAHGATLATGAGGGSAREGPPGHCGEGGPALVLDPCLRRALMASGPVPGPPLTAHGWRG